VKAVHTLGEDQEVVPPVAGIKKSVVMTVVVVAVVAVMMKGIVLTG